MPPAFPTARDQMLSLFQSAAAAVARRHPVAGLDPTAHPLLGAVSDLVTGAKDQVQDPSRAYAPPGGITTPSTTCAGLGWELVQALIAGDADQQRALHDRLSFSQCDPLWAETLIAYVRDLRPDGEPRPVPYIRYEALGDFVMTAQRPDMRVALLSDWGTGTAVARQVAALLARQRPDIVIHLGDIYYSGTAEECDAHFLAPLRAVLPNQPILTLCGNHDVYSGGDGYYELLRKLGQPASYVCLRSPDQRWQILGADTGLHDRDPFDEAQALTRLDPEEELWHADKLRGFPGRTIFLTHHQPFSAFAQIGPLALHDPVNQSLMDSHARLSQAGPIDAWFWGHEHRLQVYAPYRGVLAGRNIGYGAIPVQAVPGPEQPLRNLVDPPTTLTQVDLDVVEGAYTHGFALLDFAGGRIDASYWALTRPDGPIYRERIGSGVMAQAAS